MEFELNKEQYQAVTHVGGPLMITSGPGTGKTRVISERIKWLIQDNGVPEEKILAITFTNKAANELKERVQFPLAFISTFHKLGLSIIRKNINMIPLSSNFSIYNPNESKKLIKDSMLELEMDLATLKPAHEQERISSYKNLNIENYNYPELLNLYNQKLIEANSMDLDDILLYTFQIIKDKQSEISSDFAHVLVDEYQDTNSIQNKIILLLSENHRQVTIVFDMDQSIYAFRGANYGNIRKFENHLGEVSKVQLTKNYRSCPNILQVANNLIENNLDREAILLEPTIEISEDNNLEVKSFSSEDEETDYIFEKIRVLDGTTAILSRTNMCLTGIEFKLRSHQIPYRMSGRSKTFDSKEALDILSLIRLIHNPLDLSSFERVLSVFAMGIGEKTIARIVENEGVDFLDKMSSFKGTKKQQKSLQEIASILSANNSTTNPYLLVEELLEQTEYLSIIKDKETDSYEKRMKNISYIQAVAAQCQNIPEFLELWAIEPDRESEGLESAVILSTIHASKGLEFDNVFIIGLEESILPHFKSIEEEEIEEERRLFYVSITRAKTNLFITSCSGIRMFKSFPQKKSSFLKELNMGDNFEHATSEPSLVGKEGSHLIQGRFVVERVNQMDLELRLETGGILTINKTFLEKLVKFD